MDSKEHQACEQLVKDVKDLVDDFQTRLAQLVSNHWGTDIPVELLKPQGTTPTELVEPQVVIPAEQVKPQRTDADELVGPQGVDTNELLKPQEADTAKLLKPPGTLAEQAKPQGTRPVELVKPQEKADKPVKPRGTETAEEYVQGTNKPGHADEVDEAFLIPCPSCPLKFEQRGKLQRHWYKHVHCPFLCDFCQFETRNLSSRIRHFNRCSRKASYPAVEVEASSELLRGRTTMARANLDAILTPMGLGRGQIRPRLDADESLQNQESDPEMLGLERDSLYLEFVQSMTAPQKNRSGFEVDAEIETRETSGLSLSGLSQPDSTLTPISWDGKPRDEKPRDGKSLDALRVSSPVNQEDMIQAALRDAFPVDQDEMLQSALKKSSPVNHGKMTQSALKVSSIDHDKIIQDTLRDASPIDHDKIIQDVLKTSSSVDKLIQDDKIMQDASKVSSLIEQGELRQDALRVSSPAEHDKIQDASEVSSAVDHSAQMTQDDTLRVSADNRQQRVRVSLAALREGRATSPYGRRIPEGAWRNSLTINHDAFSSLGIISQGFAWSKPPRNGGQKDIEEVT